MHVCAIARVFFYVSDLRTPTLSMGDHDFDDGWSGMPTAEQLRAETAQHVAVRTRDLVPRIKQAIVDGRKRDPCITCARVGLDGTAGLDAVAAKLREMGFDVRVEYGSQRDPGDVLVLNWGKK